MCPCCQRNGAEWCHKDGRRLLICHSCVIAWVDQYNLSPEFYTFGLNYHKDAQETQGLVDYRLRIGNDIGVGLSRWMLLKQFVDNRRRLLDVGGGNGSFVAIARDAGMDAVLLEPNPAMAEFARQRWNLPAVLPLSFEDVPDTDQWDVITMWHVFEHFPEPRWIIEQLHRMLAPDGLVVIETPDLAQATNDGTWKHIRPLEHPFLYSRAALYAMLEPRFTQLYDWEPIPDSLGMIVVRRNPV